MSSQFQFTVRPEEIPDDPYEPGGFEALNKRFQSQFGRPLRISGDLSNNPAHKSADQYDVGTRELSDEQRRWVLLYGPRYGLRVRDFSRVRQPVTLPSGVKITGPHLHIEPLKRQPATPKPQAVTQSKTAPTFKVLVKPEDIPEVEPTTSLKILVPPEDIPERESVATTKPPASTPSPEMSAAAQALGKMAVSSLPARVTSPWQLPETFNEEAFQSWYLEKAKQFNLNPNPDAPEHRYDYRAAFAAGAGPNPNTGHWPSEFKDLAHPNRFVKDGGKRSDSVERSLSAQLDSLQKELGAFNRRLQTGEQLSETETERYNELTSRAEQYADTYATLVKQGSIKPSAPQPKPAKAQEPDWKTAVQPQRKTTAPQTPPAVGLTTETVPTPTEGPVQIAPMEMAVKGAELTPEEWARLTPKQMRLVQQERMKQEGIRQEQKAGAAGATIPVSEIESVRRSRGDQAAIRFVQDKIAEQVGLSPAEVEVLTQKFNRHPLSVGIETVKDLEDVIRQGRSGVGTEREGVSEFRIAPETMAVIRAELPSLRPSAAMEREAAAPFQRPPGFKQSAAYEAAAGAAETGLGMLGGALTGTGVLIKNLAKFVDSDAPTPLSDLFIDAGQKTRQAFEGSLAVEEGQQPGMVRGISGGLMSGLGFAALGGLGSIAPGIAGALTQTGDFYSEAKQAGLSDEAARKAALWGIPVGLTELWGLGGAAGRASAETREQALKGIIKGFFKGAFEEIPEEQIQELSQGVISDLVAKGYWDPERKIAQNAPFNVLMATISAGVLGGGMQAAGRAFGPLPSEVETRDITQTVPGPIRGEETPLTPEEVAAAAQAVAEGQGQGVTVASPTEIKPIGEVYAAQEGQVAESREPEYSRVTPGAAVPTDITEVRQREGGRPVRSGRDEEGRQVSQEVAPRRLMHERFGEVAVSENQSGIAPGHLRVTDSAGNEHIIKNPRTAGNQQAAFVRPPKEEITPTAPEATPVEGTSPLSPAVGTRIEPIEETHRVLTEQLGRAPTSDEVVARRRELLGPEPEPEAIPERRVQDVGPPEGVPERRGQIVSETAPTGPKGIPGAVKNLREERRTVARSAVTDEQTGLANKNAFQAAQKRVDADPNQEWVMIDVDRLKIINDTIGHEAGDKMLTDIAGVIREQGGKAAVSERAMFRSGGDEFPIAVPKGKASSLARAIQEQAGRIELPDGSRASVSVGTGATFKEADAAAMADKKARKMTREETAPASTPVPEAAPPTTKEPTKPIAPVRKADAETGEAVGKAPIFDQSNAPWLLTDEQLKQRSREGYTTLFMPKTGKEILADYDKYGMVEAERRWGVESALYHGDEVPTDVLTKYPDLAAKYAKPALPKSGETVTELPTKPTDKIAVARAEERAKTQPITDAKSFRTAWEKAAPNITKEQADQLEAVSQAMARGFVLMNPGSAEADFYRQFANVQRMEGQKSWIRQTHGKDVKGATEFLANGRALISAFDSADISTALHEMAHVARRYLDAESLASIEKWAGVKDGNWAGSPAAEEKFATAFERYFYDGKAPSPELQPVFARTMEFIRGIYQSLRGSAIAVKLSPEVENVFARVLGVTERATPTTQAAPAQETALSPVERRKRIKERTIARREAAQERLARAKHTDILFQTSETTTPDQDLIEWGRTFIEEGVTDYEEWKKAFTDDLKSIGEAVPDDARLRKVFEQSRRRSAIEGVEETGIKHAVTSTERERRGDPEIEKVVRKSFGEMLNEGINLIDSGQVNPRYFAELMARQPRALTAAEDAVLLYDRMRLYNEHRAVLKDLEAAIDADDKEKMLQGQAALARVETQISINDEAARRTGTETGRGLAARRMMIKRDYSLAAVIQKAKAAGNGDISPKLRERLTELTKALEESETKLADAEERIKILEAQQNFRTSQREVRKRTRRDKTSLQAEFASLRSQLAQLTGHGPKEPEGQGPFFQTADETPEGQPLPAGGFDKPVLQILGQMARNAVERGAKTHDAVVDEVYDAVKDLLPDTTKRQVRDAIAGYGVTAQLSKDEIDIQMRELKRQMRLVSALEDAERGRAPLRAGLQRDKPSERVRALTRAVAREMRKLGLNPERQISPEERWKTTEEALKTRLRNEIETLDRQIGTGEVPPPREQLNKVYDDETIALMAERDLLKKQLQDPGTKNKAELLRKVADAERKLREGDTSRAESNKFPPEIYDDPEAKLLRERLKAAQSEITRLRNQPKEQERLRAQITDLQRRIRERDFSRAEKEARAVDPVTAELRKERDALRKALRQLEGPRTMTPDQRIAATERALESAIARAEQKIATGDVSAKPGSAAWSPRIGEMQKRRSELARELKRLRDAARSPEDINAARLLSFKTRLNKQIADLERRLRDRDYVFEKRKPTDLDAEAERLRNERDKLRRQIDAEIRKQAPGRLPRTIAGLWKAGLLGRVGVNLRNITSTAAYQVFDEVSRMPGTMFDWGAQTITGQRGLAAPTPAAMLDSVIHSVKVGGREAKEIITKGMTREQAEKMQFPHEIDSGVKMIDFAANMVFRLMSAEDRIFYNFALQSSLQDRARVQALNERRVDPGVNVSQRTKDLVASPTPEINAGAQHDAMVRTFNNNNKLSNIVRAARASLGPKANLALDFVVPFDRTPTNVLSRMLEGSPLGFIKAGVQAGAGVKRLAKEVKTERAKARMSPEEARRTAREIIQAAMTPEQQRQWSQTMGRATVGTAVWTLGYMLAQAGLATGPPDDDLSKRERDKAAGRIPWAVRVPGGDWIGLGQLSPIGNLLGIGAGWWREMRDIDEKLPFWSSVGMTGKQITSGVPLIRGMESWQGAIEEPGKRLPAFAGRFAGSFIPGILADAASIIDSVEREPSRESFVQNIKESVYERIPGLRQRLPESFDIFGRPVEHRRMNVVSPFPRSTAKEDKDAVDRQMVKLDVAIGKLGKKDAEGETDADYRARAKETGQLVYQVLAKTATDKEFDRHAAPDKREIFKKTISGERTAVASDLKDAKEFELSKEETAEYLRRPAAAHNAEVRKHTLFAIADLTHAPGYDKLSKAEQDAAKSALREIFAEAQTKSDLETGAKATELQNLKDNLSVVMMAVLAEQAGKQAAAPAQKLSKRLGLQ